MDFFASSFHEKMIARRRLCAGIALVVALLGTTSIAISAVRRPILRGAGWALVFNDAVGPADVIVVMVDADGAGVLEAADFVHSGVATRVAVFGESPDTIVERENVDLIPTYVTGTESEGPVLADWCDKNRLHSVVVVSTSDHSRRLHRMLHRAMKGHPTRVAIRSARFSAFDPDRWWSSRRGLRTEVVEFEKLLLDIVRHPIS
jgi:hypothetical protein